jgi:tRNA-dihydrouridine synthase 1
MVKLMVQECKVPVTCKIRILPDDRDTLKLCKDIEEAGASIITVHGRLKEQKKTLTGECEWEIIRLIKQQAKIPIFANGGIYTFEDVQRCLEYTGADGVMSSESLLENPALFSGEIPDLDEIALEYLEICKGINHKEERKMIKPHLFKFLYAGLRDYPEIRNLIGNAKTLEDQIQAVELLKEKRKDVAKEDKFG